MGWGDFLFCGIVPLQHNESDLICQAEKLQRLVRTISKKDSNRSTMERAS
jgi:hypothetical protein